MINKNKLKKYHIRKKSIKKYGSQLGWKISGTHIEPDFIENRNHRPIDLTFTGTKTNIHLKNQHFIRLSLVRCQNIVIDNCTISQLHIEGSTNIIVRNSRLLKVKHFLSEGNTFENNIILRESYDRLIKNRYNKFVFASMLFITVFAVFFVVLSILGFMSSTYLWNSIIYLSSGIFAISISFYYFQYRIRMAKLPPNIYSNFTIIPFTDVNAYFAEVINLKQ
ncbi:MAG: hypothetical protein WBH31_17075 [Promethearchaeia archaeon]